MLIDEDGTTLLPRDDIGGVNDTQQHNISPPSVNDN
jgi:hypothetical protein